MVGEIFGLNNKPPLPPPSSTEDDKKKKKTAGNSGGKSGKTKPAGKTDLYSTPNDIDAGITVNLPQPPPQKRNIDAETIAEGIGEALGRGKGPPMSVEEAQAIAKLLGYTGVIPSPPDL